MNALQLNEIKRIAKLKSQSEINENKIVYVVIKNGTSMAQETTDFRVVRAYINLNFSLYYAFRDGEQLDVKKIDFDGNYTE